MGTTELPKLFSAEEVMDYLKINSKVSLWRLRKSGKITATKIGGRVFFQVKNIEDFLQQSTEKKLVNV